MKAGIFAVVLLLFSFLGKTYAQDTSKPVIMSQHAYDSTLRALKKAAEQEKQRDTVKQNENNRVKDTSKSIIAPVIKKDTLIGIKQPTKDSSRKVSAITVPVLKTDIGKGKKVKYAPTGFIELSYGEALPAGDFALNAYPSKGGLISITAEFPGFRSHFGFIFNIGYGFNRLDEVRYLDSLKSQAGDPLLGFSSNNNTVRYTYKTALLGLFYTYPMRKISIDARFLCGIMVATLPASSVSVFDYYYQNSLTVTTYQSSGSGFALDEGISVRYNIIPLLSASLGIDNLSAPPSFRIVENGIAPNPYGVETQTGMQTGTIIQPFHLFTVNLCICYVLAPKK